jgi:hypothetical protein
MIQETFLEVAVAANQVVLYFDKQEDAVRFTVAASSVMGVDAPARGYEAVVNIAREVSKATRIKTQNVVTAPIPSRRN